MAFLAKRRHDGVYGRAHWYALHQPDGPLARVSPARLALCGYAISGPALVVSDPPQPHEPPLCSTCLAIATRDAERRRAVFTQDPMDVAP